MQKNTFPKRSSSVCDRMSEEACMKNAPIFVRWVLAFLEQLKRYEDFLSRNRT